MFMIRMVEE